MFSSRLLLSLIDFPRCCLFKWPLQELFTDFNWLLLERIRKKKKNPSPPNKVNSCFGLHATCDVKNFPGSLDFSATSIKNKALSKISQKPSLRHAEEIPQGRLETYDKQGSILWQWRFFCWDIILPKIFSNTNNLLVMAFAVWRLQLITASFWWACRIVL